VYSNTVLDERPDLLEDLGGTGGQRLYLQGIGSHLQKGYTGCSVTDLGVLGTRNVNKGAGGGVHNVEELEEGGTVVWTRQGAASTSIINTY
jgi:hypothetical protein